MGNSLALGFLIRLAHKESRPQLGHKGHDHFALDFNDILRSQKHTRTDLA